ncbi:MAG: MarR family winged helix-turn-helix transcriptional regulator [Chloroflexi bacterium]|nr:MarR family winged helix-turn-helix transcriptional regulator [Chloroflexota bacterium]
MVERVRGPSLLFELFATGQRVRTLLAAAMTDAGLRPDEYAVYSVLVDAGPSAPTALSRAVGMPPTTMSHYVRAMVERGHVERRANPADGRSFQVALTRDGQRAHARAAAAFEEANGRFLRALAGDDASTWAVLRAMNTAAESAAEREPHCWRRTDDGVALGPRAAHQRARAHPPGPVARRRPGRVRRGGGAVSARVPDLDDDELLVEITRLAAMPTWGGAMVTAASIPGARARTESTSTRCVSTASAMASS